MTEYHFNLLLTADAEPASGLGTELVNSLLPRGENGVAVLPASHLKGIMRENLHNILAGLRTDAELFCNALFGRGDADGKAGCSGIISLTAAVAPADAKILTITRTAVDDDGIAVHGLLRTSEVLAKGTHLTGRCFCASADPAILAAARMALLSLNAVGGFRTRGAGACRVTIDEFPEETPGKLLPQVIQAALPAISDEAVYTENMQLDNTRYRALKLTFHIESAICLPQVPQGKTNVIASGCVIPATAVAGTLLTQLSRQNKDLASACFRSPVFRCGPLLPVPEKENFMIPVYISNTHKISKLRQEDLNRFLFGDLMIPDKYLEEPSYHWQKRSSAISMKGASGVLIVHDNGRVSLLKSGDIPRYCQAHGVVNGAGGKKDNLYTMVSILVKFFSGFVILPEEAASTLEKQFQAGCRVSFGKSKTVMGSGILTAEAWPLFDQLEQKYPQVPALKGRLFIVQTPIAYESDPGTSSRAILEAVLSEAGWGAVEKESVMTSVLFGWNRLKLGKQIGETGRVQAKRVILPGSVFLLKEPVTNPREKIAQGLGTDRYAGYGCVLPHPMFATSLSALKGDDAGETLFASRKVSPVFDAYELDELDQQNRAMLSPAQIAHLLRAAQNSIENAEKFLDEQRLYRPVQIWEKWEPAYKSLKKKLEQYRNEPNGQELAVELFRVWHDLKIGRKSR